MLIVGRAFPVLGTFHHTVLATIFLTRMPALKTSFTPFACQIGKRHSTQHISPRSNDILSQSCYKILTFRADFTIEAPPFPEEHASSYVSSCLLTSVSNRTSFPIIIAEPGNVRRPACHRTKLGN
ncbi:hypothetical protein F4811DRAFT_415410 [Daldinia bambusicola]|nr:hypothetical protein F4811DRAFT_415410 [Daldinia bambusicola]